MLKMNLKIRVREDFKALIPPLSEDEREGLEQSILDHGCRDALLTWNGWIIDGHNRFEICEGNGIEYRTQEMDFEDEDAVKIWMIRNQFGRRNLDAYTRAKLAIELKGLFAAKAKENMSTGGGDKVSDSARAGCQNSDNPIKRIDTKKELARIAGTSHDTIAKVERIERDATPEIKEALRTSAISINGAYVATKQNAIQVNREQKIEEASRNEWPEDQEEMRQRVESGETVVINMNTHLHLLKWAQDNNKYARVDRFTDWGNPFELGKDGNRDEVCDAYANHYFPFKKSLHSQIHSLSGKVLGCHCHPQRCHGHFLASKTETAND